MHWWPKHGENMDTFRAAVKKLLAGNTSISVPAPTKPAVRSTLRRGATGADVLYMQQRLSAHGFPLLTDGSFGPDTESKAGQFQSARKLSVDGVCGPKTWAALSTPASKLAGDPGEAAPSVLSRTECRNIIQAKCAFSDPAGVWAATQTHKYPDELYRKLASVMK